MRGVADSCGIIAAERDDGLSPSGPMSSNDILADYRATREKRIDQSVLCHAPFLSLNFEQNGHVTACCYNRSYILGTYPEQSVREIWKGAGARALREAFLRNEEAPGCELCFHQLNSRNFGGVLMRNFDQYSGDSDYRPDVDAEAPRVLEFEIANTCNLECIMCSGHWSSSIRAHREKLPPLHSPYDRSFVEQLEEFLPTVAGAKFLGGEPFLIERYYDIWERFSRLNPGAQLAITTNATILPERARALLEEIRVNFVVSLDGFTAATYETIRKNARFEVVMANLEYLLDYTRRRGTEFSIAICPMTYNWREIPALLEFCEGRKIGLHFNMVLKPFEASLGGLPPDELAEVIDYLESVRPSGEAECGRTNQRHWEGLLNQLRGWHQEKVNFARSCSDLETRAQYFGARHDGSTTDWTVPGGYKRLLPSVIFLFCLARKKAMGEQVDFLTLLLPPPIPLREDRESPTTGDLLLVAHLICKVLDEQERERATAPTEPFLDQQRLLWEYVARRGGSDPEWMEKLGDWLEERLRNAESDVLVPWIRALADGLEGVDDWHRELQEGLDTLRIKGLHDEEYRSVAAYFDALVERFYLPASLAVGSPSNGNGVDSTWRRPLSFESVVVLRAVLDALYLFHRCYEPTEDHAAFRRRLDRWMAIVVESGKTEAACRSIEAADPAGAYWALAHGSEENLRSKLEALA